MPAKDDVTVLVELGSSRRHGGLLVELDGCRDEPERCPGRGVALLHVAVGDGLRVGRRLECVLHDRPLPGE